MTTTALNNLTNDTRRQALQVIISLLEKNTSCIADVERYVKHLVEQGVPEPSPDEVRPVAIVPLREDHRKLVKIPKYWYGALLICLKVVTRPQLYALDNAGPDAIKDIIDFLGALV